MSFIITLLVRAGLSSAFAKRAAPWVAALALFAILGAVVAAWDYFDDRAAVRRATIEANNKALEAQIKAEESASRERLRNAETNSETRRSYEDAILVPRAGDSDDAGVRLACERLRRAGHDTTGLPGCGRR